MPLASNHPLDRDDSHEKRRFFFIHLMKTAGTSFVFQLNEQFAPGEVYPSAGLEDRKSVV